MSVRVQFQPKQLPPLLSSKDQTAISTNPFLQSAAQGIHCAPRSNLLSRVPSNMDNSAINRFDAIF